MCFANSWNVRMHKESAKPTKSQPRRGVSYPKLRRTGAQYEEAIRNGEPNYVPAKLSADKKVTETKSAKKKAPKKSMLRVMIEFPPMNAPFGGPRRYDDTKKVHTLVLNLRNETQDPEMQNLRATLEHIQTPLAKLIELLEKTVANQDPLRPERKNTFIHPGPEQTDEAGAPINSRFPDFVKLKMYMEDVAFVDEDGVIMDPSEISFEDYDVQPTVELRDVWKFGTYFFPRLMVTRCVLHAREPAEVFMLPSVTAPASPNAMQVGADL